MRAGRRRVGISAGQVLLGALAFLVVGCSKPEEVISRRISLANQKLRAEEVDESVRILERLDTRYPGRPAVLEALGFAYARQGNDSSAAASFVRAADLDPESSVLRQLAAEAYVKTGDLTRAAEQHRLYLAEFPGDFQSWQKLGELEEQSGSLMRAIDAYLEWYRLRPSSECAYRLGSAFRRLNNSPQAKTWYEATIRHGESHVRDALFGLLELELEAGDLRAAAQTVNQLDKNFPGALDASPLAGARQRIAAWQEAEAALKSARQKQDQLAQDLTTERRSRARELEQATRGLPNAAAERPPPGPAQPAAEASTRPAPPARPGVEAPPDVPSPAATTAQNRQPSPAANYSRLFAGAVERKERGDLQGAIDLLWRALGEEPGRVAYWLEASDCYRAMKQYAQAEACILEARRFAPNSLEVETAYLNISRESQPPQTYLARVDAARKKFPENANLAYVLAHELARAEGDALRTIAAYEDFLLLADPRDPRRTEATDFLARARR